MPGQAERVAQQKERGVKSLPLTSVEVRHAVGAVSDATIAAILECAPSQEELEVAATYLRGAGSEVDRLGHPLTGKVARLYDILSADEIYAEEES
jgi:hypothetical protein